MITTSADFKYPSGDVLIASAYTIIQRRSLLSAIPGIGEGVADLFPRAAVAGLLDEAEGTERPGNPGGPEQLVQEHLGIRAGGGVIADRFPRAAAFVTHHAAFVSRHPAA